MDKSELEELLANVVRSGASALHIHPNRVPWIRVQGRVVRAEVPPVMAAEIEDLTKDFLFSDHRETLYSEGEVEVLYSSRSGQRFRTTVFRQDDGIAVLFRRVSSEVPSLEALGLPNLVQGFTHFTRGMVLVTGFFGSGKTATLAALLDRINQDSARHLVTIEDPIEYLLPPGEALLHQREVGAHVDSTAVGVREALRQGAEVIAVGEIRDAETLEACLDAVEHGCLVLATLEASGVTGACRRLMDLGDGVDRERRRSRLASCLRVVMAQTLLQRAHQEGRVPLLETLIFNSAARRVLREGRLGDLHEVMKRGRGIGMQTVDAGLRVHLARKAISMDEALFHAQDREWLSARLHIGLPGTPG